MKLNLRIFASIAFLAVIFAAIPQVSFAAGRKNSIDLYFKTEFNNQLPLAIKGDATAQLEVSGMYAHGFGVPQDYSEAAKWARKAAEQGNRDGEYSIGNFYELGLGVPQDYQEAVKWYRKAANRGYHAAQFALGMMYKDGRGVSKDDVQAYMWLNLCAATGDHLVGMYRDDLAKSMTPDQIAKGQRLSREWKPELP